MLDGFVDRILTTQKHFGIIYEGALLSLNAELMTHGACRMAVANIMRIAYGYVVAEVVEADELVILASQVMRDVSAALAPNKYFVNVLPFREHGRVLAISPSI